jgi:hypothetical protein
MSTDLDEPLIIASVTADGTGQPHPLLIDGYALPDTVHEELAAGCPSPEACRVAADRVTRGK